MKKNDFVEKLIEKLDMNFSIKYMGKLWTRGDGSRYKDMNYIYGSESTSIDCFWDKLKTQQYKDGPDVKGEFGSCPYYPSIIIKGIIFIKKHTYIDFATTGILKNTAVWHSRPACTEAN